MTPGPLAILLVEDNLGDVVLIREAIAAAGITAELTVAGDGGEAMAILHRHENGGGAGPDVVVLDLNLPDMTGREVLAAMAARTACHGLPVAVLTSSRTDADVCRTVPAQPCGYFVKPEGFDELVAVMRQIVEFARSAGARRR